MAIKFRCNYRVFLKDEDEVTNWRRQEGHHIQDSIRLEKRGCLQVPLTSAVPQNSRKCMRKFQVLPSNMCGLYLNPSWRLKVPSWRLKVQGAHLQPHDSHVPQVAKYFSHFCFLNPLIIRYFQNYLWFSWIFHLVCS